MRFRRLLPFFTVFVVLYGQESVLQREGAYWVETLTGTFPIQAQAQLDIRTRGPVTIRGGEAGVAAYVLKKRVRARTETEARERLRELRFRSTSAGNATTLLLTYPQRPAATAE